MTTQQSNDINFDTNVDKKGLQCILTVTVPVEEITKDFNSKVTQLARTPRQGFRPGKVPKNMIVQWYKKEILQEITVDLAQKSFEKALKENNLDIANQPEMDIKPLELGKELTYTATFDCYPEVELKDFSKIKLENPVAEIDEKDVKKSFEEEVAKHPGWKEVARGAKADDQLTIDFNGQIDGKDFEGGSAKDHVLRFGHNQMLEDFEKPLKGKKKDTEVEANVVFPDDYHAQDMRGKKAVFTIKINKVESPTSAKIDKDLFKKMGSEAETEEDFLEELKIVKEKELNYQLQKLKKHYVEEFIAKEYKFDLPESVCKSEEERINSISKGKYDDNQVKEMAVKNVRTSLVFKEIVDKQSIVLDQQRFDQYLRDMASSYFDTDMFVNWYKQDKQRVQQAQAAVMESQIVDKIYELATLKDTKLTLDKVEKTLEKLEK